MKKSISVIASAVVMSGLVLVGCGGSSSSTKTKKPETKPLVKGYLEDSAIAGANYSCGDINSITTANGEFGCRTMPVSFKIGGFYLGTVSEVNADTKVFPQDLAGVSRSNYTNDKVIKITRLVQSLDSDGDPSNGISITADTREKLKNVAADASLATLVQVAGKTLVSEAVAMDHLRQSIESSTSKVIIRTDVGDGHSIDPTLGGTVKLRTNPKTGKDEVATVVKADLNECAPTYTALSSASGVVCGPKSGVTYIFQSDFGKLGVVDTDPNTPDGGVLLYDALTEVNGVKFVTPTEGNIKANRIQEVYIPTNYIVLSNDAKEKSVDEQYDLMRDYLADVCNMKCISSEPENNPYFDENKTTGEFIASYVMHFTRGTGETTLLSQYANGDKTNLEYLTVTFPLNVEQVGGDSDKLKFTAPAGSSVQFGAKRHGEDAIHVSTTNVDINSLIHESADDSDHSVTINMAKYFDKLISSGDASGVVDFAKAILVENAQNPWPVKIYGTLIEEDSKRSFVRNPATIDSSLFNLDKVGAFKGYFANDPQAQKFNLVYPGGTYNKLD